MILLGAGTSGGLFWGSLGEPFCSPSEHDSLGTSTISSRGYFLERTLSIFRYFSAFLGIILCNLETHFLTFLHLLTIFYKKKVDSHPISILQRGC
jgi:hypothetical protein